MKVLILGADGYLGWPTVMRFVDQGHEVVAVDNYLRRLIAQQTSSEALWENPNMQTRCDRFAAMTGKKIDVEVVDLADYHEVSALFERHKPDCIVHYAEQPSAPYSMRGFSEAQLTFKNNLDVTFNVIWATIEHCPEAHIVKLGTMGEYGTPNIDIEEGWLEVEHKGRSHKFLYPRQASSLYHTTKVLDTDLLWFYVRTYGLRVTDLMQGPVYGIQVPEIGDDVSLEPNFHYDDIFGTVVNRFLVQAVHGFPLTVYGKGGQTRGYLNLIDTLNCVELAAKNPVEKGDLRILNQFTEQFSVNELADKVQIAGKEVGLNVEVKSIPNPRKEMEDHYYNAAHSGLMDLGLEPNYMTTEVLVGMLERIIQGKERIDESKILPRVKWNK